MDPVENVEVNGEVVAIIVRAGFRAPGVRFFTPESFSQQLAYMKHPAGKVIEPHLHRRVRREVFFTNEVLILTKGQLRVDFYTDAKEYQTSRVLGAGDVILLVKGGHGFEVLEELEMIEVKQGPFTGDEDKVRFEYDPSRVRPAGGS